MNASQALAIAELTAASQKSRALATKAEADFEKSAPVLAAALAHNSGQSAKVAAVIRSIWGGELCHNLCGLDTAIAEALVQAIAARAHLQGDADDLLRPLIPSPRS